MRSPKRTHRWRRVATCLLAVAMLMSLSTGCHKGSESIKPVNPQESDGVEPAPVVTEISAPDWQTVTTGAEIDTLNVVLVIDTSASTLRNDPDRNWIEASCMFLNTLYASANKQATDRLAGSKHANVGVVLYNDTAIQFSESLVNLATKETVDDLKTFVRKAQIDGGDDALAEALDKAVATLNSHRPVKELSERSVILLFTDGYTGYTQRMSTHDSVTKGTPVQYTPDSENDAVTSATSSSSSDNSDGDTDSTTTASLPAYVTSAASAIPDFGDGHQAQLASALNRAKTNRYEIFVTMLNPSDNNSDGVWEQFKGIANYTRRNLMGELMPIIVSHQNIFENLSLSDFAWPDGYNLQYPKFLDDPIYGGGIFPNPDGGSDKVNYQVAVYPWELISFYATLAANMLSGSTAARYEPTIKDYEGTKHYCYDIEVPNSGISALMCFVFSSSGVSGITLKGPDPDNPGTSKDYTRILRKQDKDGWANDGAMRNDWYTHEVSPGENRNNITTLTIINPTPGTWSIYAKGFEDNRSLHTYAAMVNGAKVNISFNQGNGTKDKDGEHPVTDGDFAVQVIDDNGEPLPENFYDAHFLKTQCDVLRIPPWLPISEDDVDGLMKNFTSWLEQTLSDFKEPETWLTQMSGGQIEFQTDVYNGSPALMGHFKAPLPGLYYVTLTMTVGEGDKQIDYSKSFWVTYEAKTNRSVTINKADRDGYLTPPYLPEGWWKTSNTSEAEDLVLRIEEKTLRIKDSEYAEQPYIDPSNPQTIVIHSLKAGKTELSFDVTTEYGDRWHLTYPVIING